MKVLLDENLDHRLRSRLGTYDVITASYMGWAGLKNGKLLRAADDGDFDVFVTGDQTLTQEQNLTQLRLAIVVLSTVEWRILSSHLAKIIAAIDGATPGSLQRIDCGSFSRKKAP